MRPARAADLPGRLALVEPAAGATLRGGQTAVLRWSLDAALPSGHAIDEWEAFLSFDGGRTFPQRITPHVDIEHRSVFFQVPNVPTSEARLLLRFGNEREEHEILLPQTLRIERGEDAVWTPRRYGVGEAARAGAAGTIAWSEGDRTGHGSRNVEAAPLDAGLAGARAPQLRSRTHDEACEHDAGAASLPPPSASRDAPAPPPPARPAFTLTSPSGDDILLLIQRRNE